MAAEPNPANEAIDVPRDVVLSWTPGEFASTHDVYFGTVFDDVNDATIAAMVTNDSPVNIGGVDRAVRVPEAIGLIDDCGIWDHALNAEEVQDIFNNGVF